MKLVNAIWMFINVVLNLLYYTIGSPYFIPRQIYRWNKNRRWRKKVKEGDTCFFMNGLGKRSYGKVQTINADRTRAFITSTSSSFFGERSSFSGWYDIDGLRID